MLSNKIQSLFRTDPPRTSALISGRRLTKTLFNNSITTSSNFSSRISSSTTPQKTSILSNIDLFDEHDHEKACQTMRSLIQEIQIQKPYTSFNEIFFDRDDSIGCIFRVFNEYSNHFNGLKRITRENMLVLLDNSDVFTDEYTSVNFINDWNNLRKQMIKIKFYERKIKTLDFTGFIQLIDIIKNRLNRSKDEIYKKLIGSQVYNDIIKLKEIQNKIQLGLLPSMDVMIEQYNNMQIKNNDRRMFNKKKRIKFKKRNKKKKKENLKKQNGAISPSNEDKTQLEIIHSTKDNTKLRRLHIFEPWIKRDELDKDLKNRLFELFKLSSGQFQNGFIHQNVFIQWLRASHVISATYSMNIIEGVLSSVLARYISFHLYKLNANAFEWNGFMDCVQILATKASLSLNEFVKKLLVADEFSFQKWKIENEPISNIDSNGKTSRPWDGKKVAAAVNIMRDIIEESRKLHLSDDERKRLRSLYKEFAVFAYRRQSSHLEARLTNSVLSNWMRECRILDDKYTINELDKDFISILGDFTLNGVYAQGTRDIDFDGFLILIQTIAAHKHIRADDLVQMIFAGPRSPLQKTVEFNEHMDRTKIHTS